MASDTSEWSPVLWNNPRPPRYAVQRANPACENGVEVYCDPRTPGQAVTYATRNQASVIAAMLNRQHKG